MSNGDLDIEGTAERVYREIGAEPTTALSPMKIARHVLGDGAVRLVPATALPGVGSLARVRGQWLVFLREDAPLHAQRFVLCHELAHRLLGPSATEHQCDALAAALLLPREAFLRALRQHRWRLAPMARVFCATESCVALRAGEVTTKPLALVTPRSVRIRGAAFAWPSAAELQALPETAKLPGIRRVSLQDDRARRVLRAG
jgi:hypothetical protein